VLSLRIGLFPSDILMKILYTFVLILCCCIVCMAIKKSNDHSIREQEKSYSHEPNVKWPDDSKEE
jgi:hypothetical protein